MRNLLILFTCLIAVAFSVAEAKGQAKPQPKPQTTSKPATSVPRISVEGKGDTAKLVITTDATNAGLFFKFGSVVGIYSDKGKVGRMPLQGESRSDKFDSGDIAFNPISRSSFPKWDDIPYAGDNIDGNYHTLANIRAGKGDPCRLIGYTAVEVRNAATVLDNKTWRLPTVAEYLDFQEGGDVKEIRWSETDSPFGKVPGSEFRVKGKGGPDRFFPAYGYREGYDTFTTTDYPESYDDFIERKRTEGHSTFEYTYSYYLDNYHMRSNYEYTSNAGDLSNVGEVTLYRPSSYKNYGLPVRCVRQTAVASSVAQPKAQIEGPTSAPRISVEGEGDAAKLVITTDATNAGLFFKFGSVVGIYSDNGKVGKLPMQSGNKDEFDSGDVAFNPTTRSSFPDWKGIPYAEKEDVNIDEDYHTLANVRAGKGDPCRLMGYTVAQVRSATTVPDNKTWRLPTDDENRSFEGKTQGNTDHWWSAADSPFGGVAGGEFPAIGKGGAAKFLPAAGGRDMNNGSFGGAGYSGSYWSSSSEDTSFGWALGFFSSRANQGSSFHSDGLSVRCVSQAKTK